MGALEAPRESTEGFMVSSLAPAELDDFYVSLSGSRVDLARQYEPTVVIYQIVCLVHPCFYLCYSSGDASLAIQIDAAVTIEEYLAHLSFRLRYLSHESAVKRFAKPFQLSGFC